MIGKERIDLFGLVRRKVVAMTSISLPRG